MKKREVEHKRKQLEDRRLETEGRVVDWELQQLQRMEQNLARSTGGKGQGKGAYAYRTGYASQFQPAMVPHLPLHYTTPLPRRQIRTYSPSLPSSLPASPTGPSTKQGYAFYGAFSAPSSPVAKESVVEKKFTPRMMPNWLKHQRWGWEVYTWKIFFSTLHAQNRSKPSRLSTKKINPSKSIIGG